MSALPLKADMLCGGEKSPLCAKSRHSFVCQPAKLPSDNKRDL